MKFLILALATVFAVNANAITFITEDEVQQTLNAEKVIEISKYSVEAKLEADKSPCFNATMSKSGRAYIVKKDDKTVLFVTTHDLANLQSCGEF